MKRKDGPDKLERNFWIVVILFVIMAIALILIEGHYWNSQ